MENRFWSKVDKGPSCWTWKARIEASGYGRFRFQNRKQLAHRVAYILTYGPISSSICVLHKCDNRKCVNPSHLFLGTYKDNAIDRNNKNRHNPNPKRGEDSPNTDLTNEQVKLIRSTIGIRGSGKRWAKTFNISAQTVCDIRKGRTWKSI